MLLQRPDYLGRDLGDVAVAGEHARGLVDDLRNRAGTGTEARFAPSHGLKEHEPKSFPKTGQGKQGAVTIGFTQFLIVDEARKLHRVGHASQCGQRHQPVQIAA